MECGDPAVSSLTHIWGTITLANLETKSLMAMESIIVDICKDNNAIRVSNW
jgi:hypothetical protein